MALWTVPDMWADGACWIIAGGPSVPRQFGVPEELIWCVMNREEKPSVYSPYLAPIHGKHIIAVNNAYQIGVWIDVVFFGDCAWYKVHRKALADFPGLKVTSCNRFLNKPKEKSEGIKYLGRDKNHKHGITSNKSKLSWNNNSGAAAINLAVHFGATRIILLGFDMSLDKGKISHWHGSHGNPREKRKAPPFKLHLKGFPVIAQAAKKMGIEIINASPKSAIEVFPKINIRDLL